MTTAPGAPQIAPAAKTRWLWAVRVATLLWLLVLIASLVKGAPQGLVVFAITLAGILVDLFSKASRRALAWAFGTGSVMFVVASSVIGELALKAERWWLIHVFGLLAITLAVLPASALKAFYALGREKGDSAKLAEGILGPWILLVIIMVSSDLPWEHMHRMLRYNVSALTSLRIINTDEITYAATYEAGFSPTLAALGEGPAGSQPTPSAAGLIDTVLASGRKSGYTFTYTPGPPDKTGHIKSYTVLALPVKYGKTGNMNYFTDETGVIRLTHEDRPATAKDPAISG